MIQIIGREVLRVFICNDEVVQYVTLTWRHISGSTSSGVSYLHQTKITHLKSTIAGSKNVVGFQVAVDNCWIDRMQVLHRASYIDLYHMQIMEG